jgi:hypothetical protein
VKDLAIIVAENALATARANGFDPKDPQSGWHTFVEACEKSVIDKLLETPGAAKVLEALIAQEKKASPSAGPSDPVKGYYSGEKYCPPLAPFSGSPVLEIDDEVPSADLDAANPYDPFWEDE